MTSTEKLGAGLFNLRSLSTETMAALHDAVLVGPEAETRLASFLRRILIERGAL